MIPVPAGTPTPWRELESPEPTSGDSVLYLKPGDVTGAPQYLAEALRADGVAGSHREAAEMAENCTLELAWVGLDEDGFERLCDCAGWTTDGSELTEVQRVVLAKVNPDAIS